MGENVDHIVIVSFQRHACVRNWGCHKTRRMKADRIGSGNATLDWPKQYPPRWKDEMRVTWPSISGFGSRMLIGIGEVAPTLDLTDQLLGGTA